MLTRLKLFLTAYVVFISIDMEMITQTCVMLNDARSKVLMLSAERLLGKRCLLLQDLE